MLKSLAHTLSFLLLLCNPCLLVNITSLETTRLNTIISVNSSAQRDNYFQKNWKLIKKKGGPERQNVTKQESGIVHASAKFSNALFASCFVISWFVALLNLRLLRYLLFFLVRTLAWQGISDPCEFCCMVLYLRLI